MDHIMEPDAQFPFEQLSMTSPIMMSGGVYYIKYLMQGAPLYIQLPKCTTK